MNQTPTSAAVTPEPALPRRLFVVAVVLLGLGAGLLFALNAARGDNTDGARAVGLRGGRLPEGLEGRDAFAFDLRSARGGRITAAQLAGKPYAITFLFTQCPDICPVIGQQLRTALQDLAPRASQAAVVAVSVDPKGDTPSAVRRWLQKQGMPSNFDYAIGTERELLHSWEAYFAVPQIAGRPETTAHAGAVWLVDAEGRLRARYSGDELLDSADLSADLGRLIAERATPSSR